MYSLKFGIKIPLMAIIDGYSTYDSDDNIINYTYILFSADFNNSIYNTNNIE